MISWIERRFRTRYIKMNLVRNGEIIKRYYELITTTGFIIDHKLKKAWRIPPTDFMIKDKKAYVFNGSLENVEPFIYSDIDDEIKLNNIKLTDEEKEGLVSKEFSIPFLHINNKLDTFTQIERTKIILNPKKKIEFRAKTYMSVLKTIDIPSLYEAISGKAMNQVMRAPENKKEFKWGDILFWGILIAGGIAVTYYFVVMKHAPISHLSLFLMR